MKRFRTAVASALLVVVGVLLPIGGLELWLRLFSPQRADPGGMFERDAELGWKFVAGRSGAMAQIGVGLRHVQTNAHGFRDDPFETIDPGARRIGVLGDSFVVNVAVDRDEVFTEVLERRLPGTSVLNLGVSGYGQVQELLLLERLLAELHLDVVVLVVYLRNDLQDNLGRWWGSQFSRPTARIDRRGGLSVDPPRVVEDVEAPELAGPVSPPGSSILDTLHAFHFLRARVAFLRDDIAPAAGPSPEPSPDRLRSGSELPELRLCAQQPDAETRRQLRTLERLLLEIDSRARSVGVPVVFALAPSLVQVLPELWRYAEERAAAEGVALEVDLPNRRLMQFASGYGLSMIDLLPPLRSAEAQGPPTYHRIEQHWTASGNRAAAETLRSFFVDDPRGRAALGSR